jgi:hypothetical protein
MFGDFRIFPLAAPNSLFNVFCFNNLQELWRWKPDGRVLPNTSRFFQISPIADCTSTVFHAKLFKYSNLDVGIIWSRASRFFRILPDPLRYGRATSELTG